MSSESVGRVERSSRSIENRAFTRLASPPPTRPGNPRNRGQRSLRNRVHKSSSRNRATLTRDLYPATRWGRLVLIKLSPFVAEVYSACKYVTELAPRACMRRCIADAPRCFEMQQARAVPRRIAHRVELVPFNLASIRAPRDV